MTGANQNRLPFTKTLRKCEEFPVSDAEKIVPWIQNTQIQARQMQTLFQTKMVKIYTFFPDQTSLT